MTEEQNVNGSKRPRKLLKAIEGSQVKITAIDGSEGEMIFDFSELPENVQEMLGPFGLSHKLGDSAAGKSGAEAEEAIKTVWEALMQGEMTVRSPAKPKVDMDSIAAMLRQLEEPARTAAVNALLEQGFAVNSLL